MLTVRGPATSVIQLFFLLRVICLTEEISTNYKRGTEEGKFKDGF
jgi:hypothetical protein